MNRLTDMETDQIKRMKLSSCSKFHRRSSNCSTTPWNSSNQIIRQIHRIYSRDLRITIHRQITDHLLIDQILGLDLEVLVLATVLAQVIMDLVPAMVLVPAIVLVPVIMDPALEVQAQVITDLVQATGPVIMDLDLVFITAPVPTTITSLLLNSNPITIRCRNPNLIRTPHRNRMVRHLILTEHHLDGSQCIESKPTFSINCSVEFREPNLEKKS